MDAASNAGRRMAAGNLVRRAVFGSMNVEIYDSGLVRVGSFLTRESPFEVLRSLEYQRLSPGEGVLVIVTDRKVRTIEASKGAQRQEARARALEAAGRAVLISRQRA